MTSPGLSLASGLLLVAVACGEAPAQQMPVLADGPLLNPLGTTRASDLKAFAGRPLFATSRRPPESEEVAIDTTADSIATPKHDIKLLGVTIGPDGPVARIAAGAGAVALALRRGESIEGWVVQSVGRSSATIARDGETRVLAIFSAGAAPDEAEGTLETTGADADPGIVFGSDEAVDPDVPKVRVIDAR